MRNRHMLALLLGVAPIVLASQVVTAQQPANHAATNHQGMDHSQMNHAAPTTNATAPAPGNQTDMTVPPDEPTPEPGNMGDDQPPK